MRKNTEWIPVMIICCMTLFQGSASQNCSTHVTLNGEKLRFERCQSLGDSFSLAWTLKTGRVPALEIAFSGVIPSDNGWLGWGINPSSRAEMVGTSALIAYRNSQGAQLNSYFISRAVRDEDQPLLPGDTEVSFQSTAVEISERSVVIFAITPVENNSTVFNHVWNWGLRVTNKSPQSHDLGRANMQAFRSIDMSSGDSQKTRISPRQRLKNIHGLLNGFAWGIAIPLGIMVARYLRQFPSANPAWFYLHVLIQVSGYGAGVAGWALGLKLGAESRVAHDKHRYIGYAIFAGGTLQVLALVLRPKPYQKLRYVWNLYHHTVGYATVTLAIINIFIGFNILKPARKWKTGFIAALIALGALSLILELVTWAMYFRKKYLLKAAVAAAAASAAAARARTAQREQKSWLGRLFGRRAPGENAAKQKPRRFI